MSKMTLRYFVSVIVGGKCVHMFYSEDLCEVHVCRLMYKGCEIIVFDVNRMAFVPLSDVAKIEHETKMAIRNDIMPQHVVCIETKQIYRSVNDCASEIEISPALVKEACSEMTPISGLHYVYEKDYNLYPLLSPLDDKEQIFKEPF